MLDTFRAMLDGDAKAAAVNPSVASEPDIYGSLPRGKRFSNRAGRTHIEAYGGKQAIDWVSDCVDLYAQTTSNATYHFERSGKKLITRRTEDTPTHAREAPQDLVNLLENPNPWMDWTEHIELSVIDFLLTGEFIWLKFRPDADGKPLALYRLPPPLVDIELNSRGVPGTYIYNPPSGSPVTFQPEHILHVKRPNPHDPWRGLGVIAGGPRVYDIELALTDQTATYYEQGTKPSGVLETDRSISQPAWQKMRKRIRALYQGPKNAGEIVALERGLKFRTISANAVEGQLAQMSEHSLARIAKMFRVPPTLLGEVGGSTDRQAIKEAQRIFDNKVMRPFLGRIQSQISRGLTHAWGVDFVIDHEYVMPIEDKMDLAQILAVLPGIRVRELRAQVELPPLGPDEKDADGFPIDEIVLNLPGQPVDASADPNAPPQPGHPDQPIGSEPGAPAKPANTKPFPNRQQRLPASAAAVKPNSKAVADELRARIDAMTRELADG